MIPFAANAAVTLQRPRPLQRRLSVRLNGPDNPRKLPFPLGGSAPHLIHGSLGPPESSFKTASRSVQPFLHSSPYSVPLRYNGPLRFPPKNCPFPLGFRHPAGGGPSYGHRQHAQKLVEIVRVVWEICSRTDIQRYRQTDRHRRAHYNTSQLLQRAK